MQTKSTPIIASRPDNLKEPCEDELIVAFLKSNLKENV